MTNFYKQYKSIEPYLKKKKPLPAGAKENLQTISDRKKLVRLILYPGLIITRMGFMSAFSVLAVLPLAPRTGGTKINISAPLF